MPTPKFANLQEILAEESDAETGVVSEKTEERLEVEMRVRLSPHRGLGLGNRQ